MRRGKTALEPRNRLVATTGDRLEIGERRKHRRIFRIQRQAAPGLLRGLFVLVDSQKATHGKYNDVFFVGGDFQRPSCIRNCRIESDFFLLLRHFR